VSQARSQRSGFGRRGKATRIGLSMRWWLAILFALIAAVTAVSVAYVLTVRSERALRDRAEETAAGYAFRAALAINDAEREQLEGRVETLAEERRVALFVYAEGGLLLTQRESFGIDVSDVPRRKEALAEAEKGRRFLATLPEARATVVALPLRTASGADALIAYVPSPEYGASIGILRGEIARSALLAVLVGAVVGALVAFLIARRLRRIAATAAEIERGHFDQSLHPVFRDEVGELAATVERMRARLQASFDELESERDRLSRLLEQLHEGVVAVNRDMEVVVANSPAARTLAQPHLKEGDPLPQPWPDFSLRDFAKRLFDPGIGIEEARVSPDPEHTYSVTGIPAGPESETVVLVLGDVSERERREQAEREFVTNAAHELRTPLQTILGAVEVLQAGAKERPVERERFLGHIEREATRLARLAKALLILARVQTGAEGMRVEPVVLRPVIDDVVAGLKPPDEVEIKVSCPRDVAVKGEPDLIEQALFNLAKNAVEHTKRGRIELTAKPLHGTVSIEVSDTGPGIPFEKQERIFDRFYRGPSPHSDGFGLGLAIAYQAVRALGGVLDVKSSPGTGTTARIELPPAIAPRQVA
jgi:two-component system sensor histidine kinase VicK